ncbi:MAG: hypothetical protein KAQ72_07855 [Desulfobacula sp.]|nr:hypothetical protein [Desulfobacula sp.]
MQKHTIEIDSEVFNFLQSQAEPFVDSPNDVLRRLLMDGSPRKSNGDIPLKITEIKPPKVPAGTPKALEHILQVIYLSHIKNISRSKATRIVADLHGVASQTVLDKYCRQLNLSASEFDKLLAENRLVNLKNKLYNKFSSQREVIDSYLESQTI